MLQVLNCAIYLFAVGMAVLATGKLLPRKWFPSDRFPFKTWRWERGGRIYRKLRLQRWKDRMPDASLRSKNMVRKKTGTHPDTELLQTLVAETCVAEISHWALMVLSLPVLWIHPGTGGRIIMLLCILGNFVFVIIQRYNRPRLLRALKMRSGTRQNIVSCT